MRRVLVALAVSAAIGASVAGCGRDFAEYSEPKVCDIDTATIVDLIGTRDFRVTPSRFALPMERPARNIGTTTPPYRCSLDYRDDYSPDLDIEIKYDDQLGVDSTKDLIRELGSFDVVDGKGIGAVKPQDPDFEDSVRSYWVCGTITGSTLTTVEDWNEAKAREFTEELARAAGCVTRPGQETS